MVMGLVEPTERTLVGHLVGKGRRGMGYAWYSFTSGIAALPASLVCGLLYQSSGPMAAFAYGSCLAVLAVLILITVPTPGTEA